MTSVTLEEAQARLPELIDGMGENGEVVLTREGRPVARIVPEPAARSVQPPRQPGTLKDKILYMAPDFDAPLEDFKEYME